MFRLASIITVISFSSVVAFGQAKVRSNPYTPSPSSFVAKVTAQPTSSNVPVADRSTSFAATALYRIGAGDILEINITNSSNGRGMYTVRNDGTIDFPLAGDNVKVEGQSAEAVKRQIEKAVKLYSSPKVEVKVREYASHPIIVSGLVENGGTRFIQREAVPLFVVCADAIVNPHAKKVIVKDGRTGVSTTHLLNDPDTANIVINTGDELEFTGS